MSVTLINSDIVKNNLRRLFVEGEFDKFSALLLKHDAIVAGGAILSAFHNDNINDLDIYVTIDKASDFYFDFSQEISTIGWAKDHLAPPYDQSFLARNNILCRESGGIKHSYPNGFYHTQPFDLMVANVDDITEVPKNFDLTFCMVWYNGRDVFAVHPDDVQQKKGILQPDYVKALLQGNTFTLKRMEKYKKRGYKITYSPVNISSLVFETRTKKPISADFWATWKFLTILISSLPTVRGHRNTFTIEEQNYTKNFNTTILILTKMKKIQREHSTPSLFNFSNFKILFNSLYEPKLADAQLEITTAYATVFSQFNLTINMVLNIIMCNSSGVNICLLDRKWKKYMEEATGVLFGIEEDTQPHGFGGERVPMCRAILPPLEPGQNGVQLPLDSDGVALQEMEYGSIIERFYLYIIDLFLRFSNGELLTLLRLEYPELTAKFEEIRLARAAAAAVTAEEQRQASASRLETIAAETAARNAAFLQRQREQGELEEEEEEEEAVGEYTLPGSERKVPGRCFSATSGSATGEINTSSWYPDPNHILFLIEFAPGLEPDLVCISVDELERNLSNNDKIIYKCTPGEFVHPAGDSETLIPYNDLPPGTPFDVRIRDIDRSVEYIFFTYGVDERGSTQGYLPKPSVQRIIDETLAGGNARVYKLSFVDTFSHIADKHGNYARLGVNHCQAGSSALIFKVDDFSTDSGGSIVVEPRIRRERLLRDIERVVREIGDVESSIVDARERSEAIANQVQDVVDIDERERIQEEWAGAVSVLGEMEVSVRDLRTRRAELETELAELEDVIISPSTELELSPPPTTLTDARLLQDLMAGSEWPVDAQDEDDEELEADEADIITSQTRQEAIRNLSILTQQRNAAINAMHAAVEAREAEEDLEEDEEHRRIAAVVVAAAQARSLADAVREARARLNETTGVSTNESRSSFSSAFPRKKKEGKVIKECKR